MSLAEGSLQASRRKSDAGRGNTGTNCPVRESHASRNRTVGDLATDVDVADEAVGYDIMAATDIVPHSTSRCIHDGILIVF